MSKRKKTRGNSESISPSGSETAGEGRRDKRDLAGIPDTSVIELLWLTVKNMCLHAEKARAFSSDAGEAAVSQFFQSLWLAMAAVLIWLGLMSPPAPPSFQGYVEGEFVLVSPTVGGQLVTLAVERGQQVAAGVLLFVLDQGDEKAARDQAA